MRFKMPVLASAMTLLLSIPAFAQTKPPAAQPAGQKQLSGKVLGIHNRILYVEGEKGEAVPLLLDQQTSLDGQPIQGSVVSGLQKNVKAGDQVQTSFDVVQHQDQFENIARSVQKK